VNVGDSRGLSRRGFLVSMTGVAGALLLPPRRARGATRRVLSHPAVAGPHDRFFAADEYRTADALLASLVPPVGGQGGARAARAVEYLDLLLGSDLLGPPPLFHRGPFSGRTPYPSGCAPGKPSPPDGFRNFRPLATPEAIAWKLRLDGSAAHPGLDRNVGVLGGVVGWRERYRTGLARMDANSRSLFGQPFADLDENRRNLVIAAADQSFVALAYAHAVEGTYSAPEYGGNAELAGWRSIGFAGDRQPLGYVDPTTGCELEPVSGPDRNAAARGAIPISLDPEALWRVLGNALSARQASGPELRQEPAARASAARTRSRRAPRRRCRRRPPRRKAKPRRHGHTRLRRRARRRRVRRRRHGHTPPRPRAKTFDVVIVGSGPGASMAALVLARAGQEVLVLERGPNPYSALGSGLDSELTGDELKAFQRAYGWADPLTEPRTFRSPDDGQPRTYVGSVNDLPALVGGGAGLATMLAPRMREVDFQPRSRFGDVAGSILTDWPMGYADLEPHYDAVERIVGVQGAADDPNASPRRGGFPLPAGVPLYANEVIAAGAQKLGITAPTGPLAITSKPYGGRPGCNECGRCWHYGCPIGAHGGMAPAVLGGALASGHCEVRPHSFVAGLESGASRVDGVRYLDEDGREHVVAAGTVLLGAGPIEDVRLLLLSALASRDRSKLLGRGIVFHFQTFAGGYFSRHRLHSRRGRGLARMITEFAGPPTLAAAKSWAGAPGGGVVEISGLGLFGPIAEGQTYPYGGSHANFMSANLFDDHIAGLLMQGEDLPQATTVVDLDPGVVDFRGVPVARLTYKPHPFELQASAAYGPRLAEILMAAGADVAVYAPKNAPANALPPPSSVPPSVLGQLPLGGLASGPFAPVSPVPNTQHILSGLRMGRDPDASVCDPDGRLHGFKNLYCVDGGLFCSSTPVNPTLTIWALAHRVATKLAERGRPPQHNPATARGCRRRVRARRRRRRRHP
jgi:choline dehydrogenase-like flavoprotein